MKTIKNTVCLFLCVAMLSACADNGSKEGKQQETPSVPQESAVVKSEKPKTSNSAASVKGASLGMINGKPWRVSESSALIQGRGKREGGLVTVTFKSEDFNGSTLQLRYDYDRLELATMLFQPRIKKADGKLERLDLDSSHAKSIEGKAVLVGQKICLSTQ